MNPEASLLKRVQPLISPLLVFLATVETALLLLFFGKGMGGEIGLVFVIPAMTAGLLFDRRVSLPISLILMLVEVVFPHSQGLAAAIFQSLVFPLTTFLASMVKENSSLDFEGKLVPSVQKMTEENARLTTSLNSLNVGFLIVDSSYRLVSMNSAAKLLANIKPKSGVKGVILDPLAFKSNYELDDVAREFESAFDLKKNLELVFKESRLVDLKEVNFRSQILHVFISPIVTFEKGKLATIGTVVMIEDITNEKMLERTRDEFFSIASHELRTPLTSIRGNTSLIKQFYQAQLSKDKNLKEMIDDVHDSSVRLIEIVNDFLDTSRLEQGRLVFKLTKFDFNGLAEEVVKNLSALAQEKNLYLKLRPATRSEVFADRDRVKQVLINLVGNSLKFTQKGGVEITSGLEGLMLKVLVTDTGKGIEENNQKFLFRKFQQAENNILTRDSTKGTGLGLYISKLMVEGMGGKIYLESSTPFQGTTFIFTLPSNKPA